MLFRCNDHCHHSDILIQTNIQIQAELPLFEDDCSISFVVAAILAAAVVVSVV